MALDNDLTPHYGLEVSVMDLECLCSIKWTFLVKFLKTFISLFSSHFFSLVIDNDLNFYTEPLPPRSVLEVKDLEVWYILD